MFATAAALHDIEKRYKTFTLGRDGEGKRAEGEGFVALFNVV